MTTNANTSITAQHSAEVEQERAFTQESLQLARTIRVTSPEAFAMASEVLKDVKARWKRLDERKKEITGPLQDALRSVTALFSGPLGDLNAVELHLKSEVGRYTLETEQARRDAMAKAAAEYAAGQTPLISDVPDRPEAKGVSVREVTDWEITDPERVPRQFCSPDDAKIKAHLAAGGLEAIPGVRFFRTSSVTVRAK